MRLRDYQERAATSVFAYFEHYTGSPLLVLPTAAGKSVILAGLCRMILERWPGQRLMILSHVKELLVQDFEKIRAVWPGAPVGMYSAGLGQRSSRHPIVVAGIQSAYRKPHVFGHRDLIFIDEAHLLSNDSGSMYRKFIAALQEINPRLKVIGLTASPFRTNSGLLVEGDDRLFTDVACEVTIQELLDGGYISPLVSKSSVTQADLSGVRITAGEYNAKDAEAALDQDAITQAALREALALAADRRSWLFFCSGVAHAEHVCAALRSRGISAACVTGKTPSHERDRILREFKAGRIRAVTNANVLTVGFDSPGIDLIVLLRATVSPGLYLQMCLDHSTQVLTPNGWKQEAEVCVGDTIAAFDMHTERVLWVPTVHKTVRPLADSERMYAVKSPHLSIRVTGGHDIVYKGRSKTSVNWRKRTAEDLAAKRDMFVIPVAAGNDPTPDCELTDDEIRFVGWVLTDGTISKQTNAIIISQSSSKPVFCAEIERVIKSCGFKHSVREVAYTGELAGYAPQIRYIISKGKPRGSDKHLTGWGRLDGWVSKTYNERFERLSARQLWVLIEAMNLGDGSKPLVSWVQRTYSITMGNDRRLADDLQSLLIRKGFRCNQSVQKANGAWKSTKDQYILRISRRKRAGIGGSRKDGKPRCAFLEDEAQPGEIVWCLTNALGTLVTRRNGKVAIVGNCGRGMRIFPGKTNCLVLDFANNIQTHGPVTHVTPPSRKRGKKAEEEPKVKICELCRTAWPLGTLECAECGNVMVKERDMLKKLEHKASDADVMMTHEEWLAKNTAWVDVEKVQYARHRKEGSPDSMRVEYRCGMMIYSEWICLDHPNFAGKKARKWWNERSPAEHKIPADVKYDLPVLTQHGLNYSDQLATPSRIRVQKDGKYFKILDHDFTGVQHELITA